MTMSASVASEALISRSKPPGSRSAQMVQAASSHRMTRTCHPIARRSRAARRKRRALSGASPSAKGGAARRRATATRFCSTRIAPRMDSTKSPSRQIAWCAAQGSPNSSASSEAA
jgi:hypothetical protein